LWAAPQTLRGRPAAVAYAAAGIAKTRDVKLSEIWMILAQKAKHVTRNE